MNKEERIYIRCSILEKERLKELADNEGLTIASYIRMKLIGRPSNKKQQIKITLDKSNEMCNNCTSK